MSELTPELQYLEPWDRQPDERSNEWRAFQIYRDLGYARTYQKVADHKDIPVEVAQIYNYARKNNWVERARAWDVYQDQIFQAEKAQALKDMAFRQAKNINDAVEALMTPIQAMLSKAEDPDFKADLMRVDFDELIKAAQASSRALNGLFKAERAALGAASEITEVRGTVNHELKLDPDDEDKLGELLDLANRYILNGSSDEGEAEDIIDAEVIEIQRHDPTP